MIDYENSEIWRGIMDLIEIIKAVILGIVEVSRVSPSAARGI
jgi:hypothetical protein